MSSTEENDDCIISRERLEYLAKTAPERWQKVVERYSHKPNPDFVVYRTQQKVENEDK